MPSSPGHQATRRHKRRKARALQRLYINGRFTAQNLSGVQRFATELTLALQQLQGDSVQLLAPPPQPDFPGAMVAGRRRGQLWEQFDLPSAARDGLLINLGNTAPLLSRRQVIVIHDAGVFSTPEAYSWKFKLWYKFMQGMVVRSGTPVITVSEFSRAEIIRHLRAAPSQVAVIPEGSDHMGKITADNGILATHGLKHRGFVLVVGTLAAHKNLRSLGLLAQYLARRGVPLVIAGGMGGDAFRNNTAGLPQPARFTGRVTDEQLKALYQAAACFVFPSHYEGFGLPAVEAMASGCPVVAADIPALRETCGDAASYCDPGSPEDIARQVMLLLDDNSLHAQRCAAGLAHTQNMTWRRAAESLLNILSTHERSTT
jgi:glycosyltransferase involved in cell wall biosynthesis